MKTRKREETKVQGNKIIYGEIEGSFKQIGEEQ